MCYSHWKWVIHVFKNIFSFKTSKPILGIVAKIATVALLVFGCYQMYSTNFILQLQGVTNVFTLSSSQMPKGELKVRDKPNLPEGFEKGEQANLSKGFEDEKDLP